MQALTELERRATDRFATIQDVAELKVDVRNLKEEFSDHKSEFAILMNEFKDMRRVLERIFWAIVTPLLGASGMAVAYVAYQVANGGF